MSDNNQAPETVDNRIFVYGDHTFADPGPGHTAEQVRAHLAAYFPELGQATIKETKLPDGKLEVSFHKQITTKGSDMADIEAERVQQLTAVLSQLPPLTDPLPALLDALDEPLTYDLLLQVYPPLAAAAGHNDREAGLRQGVIKRCLPLRPVPLTAVPLGY
ncbi:MAG: PRTRC system protein C [Chloroflexota bacterium]